MKVKATVSFCGPVSMIEGQVLEVQEGEILSDLLNSSYVVADEKKQLTPKVQSKKVDSKNDERDRSEKGSY